MSKSYYLGRFIIGALVLAAVLALESLTFTLVVGLYFLYVYIKFHKEMWRSIQDTYVRTTPGKAAWFLLIPIFNLYWYFVVYPGFVKDYNGYVQRRSCDVKRIPLFPFRAYAVLHLILACLEYGYYSAMILIPLLIQNDSGSPYRVLNIILVISQLTRFYMIPFSIIYIIFFLMIISKACDAVNALSAVTLRRKSVPVEAVAGDSIGDSSTDE